MLNGMISQLAIDKFSLSMRNFFGPIVKFIYYIIAKSINLMNDLAANHFELDTVIEDFLNSIFVLLIIFMVFKLTISMLTFLINPDSFSDKSAGFSKMIIRIVVSIVLLASIQPIFRLLYNMQDQLLNGEVGNVIDNVFFSNESTVAVINDSADGTDTTYIYTINKMDPHCPDDYEMYAASRGDAFAMQALRPFYTINYPTDDELNEVNVLADKSAIATNMDAELEEDGANGYCGVHKIDFGSDEGLELNQEQAEEFLTYPHTVSQLLSMKVYSNVVTDDTTAGTVAKLVVTALNPAAGATVTAIDQLTGGEEYVVDFSYIWALIFGILIALLIISFCFDVVIRAFTLFLYQIIAPIPIISYMSPNKKDSDMLMNWVKKTLSCWASVFIRVAILDIVIYLVNIILNSSTVLSLGKNGLIAQIFIIAGALMFAKKLPKLLEEIIPGLKLDGGFKLNPFKRFREEALGGQMISDAVGRTAGMISGGIGGALAGHKAGSEVGDPAKGTLLGALSGIGTGFNNKKMSFGKAMNESYKNLTGNEFRRLSPTTMMLSKSGQSKVEETKDYTKKGYEQLNRLRTNLNISETRTAALAQELSSHGYDVANVSTNDLYAQIDGEIQSNQTEIRNLEANSLALESDMNRANADFTTAESTYNSKRTAFETAQRTYDAEQARLNKIEADLAKRRQDFASGKGIGSSIQNEINRLEGEKSRISSNLSTLQSNINTARGEMDSSHTAMETARTAMETATQNYNNNINEIARLNDEIQTLNNDRSAIDNYSTYRSNEDQLRSTISAVEKDIDTIKKEKMQRERFYRIDPAPQQDYKDAKDHIDNRNV